MWGPFCYFLLHGGGSCFGLAPPPPPTKISAGAHDRNLVNSGHVLLRFRLKNDKNNDKL